MVRFISTDGLTDEEWEELFAPFKEYNPGDKVEAPWRVIITAVCEVVALLEGYYARNYRNKDVVYKVKNLANGEIALFNSTWLIPLGTFIERSPYESSM
jgi:hypothetical protein